MDEKINLLGVCEKYNEAFIGYGTRSTGELSEITRKDIIGLKEFHISSIFPLTADNFFLVFLFDIKWLSQKMKPGKEIILTVTGPNNKEIGFINMKGEVIHDGKIYNKYFLQGAKVGGVYNTPGTYTVSVKDEGKKTIIGTFELIYQKALPMTEERIQAIKSDPLAAKYLRIEMSCKKCKDKLGVFCGIDRGKEKDTKENVWYEDLPDFFKCKCGNVENDLRYLKESMHSLLGFKKSNSSYGQAIERCYTSGALENVLKEFNDLLADKSLGEEIYQKFIEEHPIIFSFFSPKLLKFKAPVTSKYKTDFVVFNAMNELVLIEIEKPTTKLFTAKGTQHSELTHALDQVENWLSAGSRNRLALIDDIKMEGLNIDNITNVKGVVIAGRSDSDNFQNIEKIRNRGNIDFYTYDDLLKGLVNTIKYYKKL